MQKKKKKGFTLVEIIAAVASFMIVMLAITTILISVIQQTGTNKRIYDANSISKSVFEVTSKNKPKLTSTPATLNGVYILKDINNEDDVRNSIVNQLYKSTLPKVGIDAGDISFVNCKDDSGQYSVVMNFKWLPQPYGTETRYGCYEVTTWTYENDKGESSLVKRTTYVTPR